MGTTKNFRLKGLARQQSALSSIFLVWLKMTRFEIQGEISTNKGMIDAVLKQNEFVVIAGIKYGVDKQPE
jgi:hypothetical protein